MIVAASFLFPKLFSGDKTSVFAFYFDFPFFLDGSKLNLYLFVLFFPSYPVDKIPFYGLSPLSSEK